MKSLRKFILLPVNEKVGLINSFFLLITIKSGLLVLPFELFKKTYAKFGCTALISEAEMKVKIQSIKIISSKFKLGFTCLPQALALKYYLKENKNAKLIIGVNKQNNELIAHAWVEKNGVYLIGDTPLQSFFPIWEWS